jgi:hypothetical protein
MTPACPRTLVSVLWAASTLCAACGGNSARVSNETAPDADGGPSSNRGSAGSSAAPDDASDVGSAGGGRAGATAPSSGAGSDEGGGSSAPTAGGGSGSSAATTDAGVPILPPVTTPTPADAELATASGCAGVYNPDQLLTLSFEVAPGDWATVLADTSYSILVPAQMQCEDEPPLTVAMRRKRSGGRQKVGLKIDVNELVAGQEWYGLKKLSLENGVSSGDEEDGAEIRAYVAEYLSWRMMVLSGTIASRAAFVTLRVNGESLGVYVDVEQVDKRFLDARLRDDTGWLYKKSGGIDDGLKTHELDGVANPFEAYFCFWASGNTCPLPGSAELLAELPQQLDIPQFLRFGAVNALIANTDGPLFKDNNYYHYDYASGPRVYMPWDLDTTMKDSPSVFMGGGGGGGSSDFNAVLFMHWRDDYALIVQELVADTITQAVVDSELDRALSVAGEAFDADPYVTGTTADAVESLSQYWTQRLSDVQAELQ